jgi:hypothetical protein
MEDLKMDKCPKIGDRVSYLGGLVVGPCTGTVTAIYKQYRYPDDFDWDSDETPRAIGTMPEYLWHVGVQVDSKPEKWCYGDADGFAPEVKDITSIEEGEWFCPCVDCKR